MTAHFKFSIETFPIVHKIVPLTNQVQLLTRNLEYRAFTLLGTIHILHRHDQLEITHNDLLLSEIG